MRGRSARKYGVGHAQVKTAGVGRAPFRMMPNLCSRDQTMCAVLHRACLVCSKFDWHDACPDFDMGFSTARRVPISLQPEERMGPIRPGDAGRPMAEPMRRGGTAV